MKLHPNVEHLLKYFISDHLPPHLGVVSQQFETLAYELAANLPSNPEKTVALRKLLESKDCAVRAVITGESKRDG